MAEINVEKQFSASPDEVWARAGNPATVSDWIPAIGSSRVEGDVRHVVFTDGNPARERIVELRDEDRNYTYRYIDGPLALEYYQSRFAVVATADGGSAIRWSAEFTAASREAEAELAAAIEGIYTQALDELATQLADR
ncbi:SRPBCC family protein [Nocardia sp. NPDC052254]|uniref:SRPBCC family protein n=1 Tax=Nocardia sp. NPDC052254 TaxID=3155681 RepID=UPI003440B725